MYSGGPFGYRPISLNPHTYYLLDLSSKVSTLPRVCVPLPRPGNLDPAQSLLGAHLAALNAANCTYI